MSTAAATPDLAAIKQKQQATWSSGDFHVLAEKIVFVSEHLVDTADIHAGWRVLDVATGSGNAALAAARLGATVAGIDYVPSLIERGRERAATEGLEIDFLEGDAEAIPYPADSFDAVTTVFGSMFAPDHQKAADELVRVAKPGGTIAIAAWTPDRLHRRPVPHHRRSTSRRPRVSSRRSSGAPRITSRSSSETRSRRSRSRSGSSRTATSRPSSSWTSSARGTARR